MDSVEEVKSRLDIVDLVGEYLSLKPAGSGSFKAVCPFHQEKTPSFYVSRGRQSWHCFGCDLGGDQFSFVQKMEGMEFREALEFLAQKAGVALPSLPMESSSLRKRCHEVNDLAQRFFQSTLRHLPQAEAARRYLQARGVDDLSLDLFHIGYAPAGWSSLIDALTKQGVSVSELVQAGLAAPRDQGGAYDRFRDRIMFPIHDVHGHVVGFTGRILTESKTEAKYVNTPETLTYKKSAVLYGLDKAKGEIRRLDQVVIVEGNMDVVSSHQFGVRQVVAASGTALTEQQLSLLKRFTNHLAIAFDQDKAGQAATLRGLDLARSKEFSIRIIQLPPDAGKDADEVLHKDPAIWRRAIADAREIMDWIYQQAFRHHSAATAQGKTAIAGEILPELKRLANPIERDHWLKQLSKDLSIGEQALQEALARTNVKSGQASTLRSPMVNFSSEANENRRDRLESSEERLLACAIASFPLLAWLIDDIQLADTEFPSSMAARLYAWLQLQYTQSEQSKSLLASCLQEESLRSLGQLPAELQPIFDRIAFIAERDFRQQPVELLRRETLAMVRVLRRARQTQERQRLEQEMRDAERQHDQERIAALAQQFEQLHRFDNAQE